MALIQSIWLPRRGKKSTMAGTKKTQVLAKGEFFTEYPDTGVGTGHGKVKMGDGVRDYEHLPYFLGDTENEKIAFSSNTSTTVAGALNAVVSGATLKNLIAGLKQAISLSDARVTKLNDDFAKDHNHDDRYFTENEILQLLRSKADVIYINKDVYVSPSGNDNNDGKSWATAYATIQKALDNAPVAAINSDYTIHVAGGTYQGFSASRISANLLLYGNVTFDSPYNPEGIIFISGANISIRTNGANTYTITVRRPSDNRRILYVANGGALNCYRINFFIDGNGSQSGIEIASRSNFSSASEDSICNISRTTLPLTCSSNATFSFCEIKGSGNAESLKAHLGGRISCGKFNVDGSFSSAPNLAYNGGEIRITG